MEWFERILDVFLHLDKHLHELVSNYGAWTYGVLFLIVFCETGLVVTPFLPGDSLLFAAGALAGGGSLNVALLMGVLLVAAVLGDTVNYQIGHYLGPRVFREGHRRWLKPGHLERTHQFFEKYGGKTIIIARFVPIVRTFAPFVAGVGEHDVFEVSLAYNVIGAVLWVVGFVMAGYWFGGLEIVKRNFTLVILAIIVISILPGVWEYARARAAAKREAAKTEEAMNRAAPAEPTEQQEIKAP